MNQSKQELLPKLRFPEFKDSQLGKIPLSWDVAKLENLVNIVSGQSPSKFDLTGTKYKFFKVNQLNFCKKYLTNTEYAFDEEIDNLLDVGTIIFPKRGASIFTNKVRILTHKSFIDTNLMGLITKDTLNNMFLYYWLVKFELSNIADTSSIPQINNKHINLLKIPFPPLEEQQKIADCLSSIDDLITAESKKLESIKNHKKGLMQNLFPSEGKTTPNFRFPEFKNDGEWEVKPLGKICKYSNGGGNENNVVDNGKYYLISLNSIDTEGNLKPNMKRVNHIDNSLIKNDLVMVLSDVAYGNFLGLSAIIPNNNYVLNQRMAGLRVRSNQNINIEYLRLFINNNQKYFKQKGQGSSQQNLSKPSVERFPIFLPNNPKEQQKIADCLSSIDDLITSQGQKIEALKTHKKGLMQQLFPNIDQNHKSK